jgi:hypothetical protein
MGILHSGRYFIVASDMREKREDKKKKEEEEKGEGTQDRELRYQ